MQLSFYGAAREVTGSRHLLKVNGKRILLDCGLFQGRRREAEKKNGSFQFNAKEIDAVILSHAHIDHSGALPKLVKDGFPGPIYSTFATRDLCSYMLLDSAHIQESEYEWRSKKKKRGKKVPEPLYDSVDAMETLTRFTAFNYRQSLEIFPGIKLTLFNAGHILGSALVHLEIKDEEDGKKKTLLFTGDLGRKNLPILRNPHQIKKADYLISECTYGNRFHEAITDIENEIADVVNRTAKRGGNIIIPAFSLGRTQEVVYILHRLIDQNRIPEGIPIVVDSPLSVNVTSVFRAHPEDFDKEAYMEFVHNKHNPFGLGRIKYTHTVEESKALKHSKVPTVIISASGMCEHGRILHHLKNNIEDPKNTVLIVGFQARNTLGRKIIEGNKEVNIFGKPYAMRAEVVVENALSGHADRSDLIDFITKIKGLKRIFLVHGEEMQAEVFKTFLDENNIKDVEIPYFGDSFTLND